MRTRPGDGAFSRRASPLWKTGRWSAGRCLPPRPSKRSAAGTSVASPDSWRLVRAIASDRHATSEAAEIDSTRRPVKERRASPIRSALFDESSAHRGLMAGATPGPLDPLRFLDAHVMRIIEPRRTALPFIPSELTSACAPCPRLKLEPRPRAPVLSRGLSTRATQHARFSGSGGGSSTSATRTMCGHELRAVVPRMPRAGATLALRFASASYAPTLSRLHILRSCAFRRARTRDHEPMPMRSRKSPPHRTDPIEPRSGARYGFESPARPGSRTPMSRARAEPRLEPRDPMHARPVARCVISHAPSPL